MASFRHLPLPTQIAVLKDELVDILRGGIQGPATQHRFLLLAQRLGKRKAGDLKIFREGENDTRVMFFLAPASNGYEQKLHYPLPFDWDGTEMTRWRRFWLDWHADSPHPMAMADEAPQRSAWTIGLVAPPTYQGDQQFWFFNDPDRRDLLRRQTNEARLRKSFGKVALPAPSPAQRRPRF